MIDWIFDLLPDEPGEYLGCALATGATVAIAKSLDKKIVQEKRSVQELKQKIQGLSSQLQEKCLSDEALTYIRSHGKKS
jgi:hypothetical protein